MNKIIDVFNVGRLDYKKCLHLQKFFLENNLSALRSDASSTQIKNTILIVEHNPVYTVGIRRKNYPEGELNKLRDLGAQVEQTDRGGLITFHGHGQLVAYPILYLKNFNPSLKWYVEQLESVIIDLCKTNYDLEAYRLCNIGYTGVWCQDKKIAAIGIHCKRYVTYHGLALNSNVDLNWFDHIVPCGIDDKKVTSLSELVKREVTVDEATPVFLKSFANKFNADIRLKSDSEVKEILKEI